MCFSANGSFALSAVLLAVGTATVTRNNSAPHRMLAAMPLLFGAQQAAEGLVWVTFGRADQAALHHAAVMTFVTVAMVIWPFWVATSLRLIERDPLRRRMLTFLSAFGALAAATSAVLLVRLGPVATIRGHSIAYDFVQTTNTVVSLTLLGAYVLPTVGPFFLSTLRTSSTIGLTLLTSLVITFVLRREAFTSVWCFFAALLSLQILFALERERSAARGEVLAA